MKRRAIQLLLSAALCSVVTALPGCYREIVSATGPGAEIYQEDIKNAHNYSGLPFDDARKVR